MLVKSAIAGLLIGIVTSIAVTFHYLNQSGCIASIDFIKSKEADEKITVDRLKAILDTVTSTGIEPTNTGFLRNNQDLSMATVLLVSQLKREARVQRDAKGESSHQSLNVVELAELRAIYERGLTQSVLDEKIALLQYLLRDEQLSSMYSEQVAINFQAELAVLENNPATIYFHANRVAVLTGSYPNFIRALINHYLYQALFPVMPTTA